MCNLASGGTTTLPFGIILYFMAASPLLL